MNIYELEECLQPPKPIIGPGSMVKFKDMPLGTIFYEISSWRNRDYCSTWRKVNNDVDFNCERVYDGIRSYAHLEKEYEVKELR